MWKGLGAEDAWDIQGRARSSMRLAQGEQGESSRRPMGRPDCIQPSGLL